MRKVLIFNHYWIVLCCITDLVPSAHFVRMQVYAAIISGQSGDVVGKQPIDPAKQEVVGIMKVYAQGLHTAGKDRVR